MIRFSVQFLVDADENSNESGRSPGTDNSKGSKNKRFLTGYNYSFKLIEPSKFKVQPNDTDTMDYRPPFEDYIR